MQKTSFVMVSNYLNHHQMPFCDRMYELLKESFVFIQTENVEEERVKMGWSNEFRKPYLKFYLQEPDECKQLIKDSKVILFGGSDDESFIRERLASKKTVIRYSERIYKEGQWKAISPRGLLHKYMDHTKYRNDDVYMLCAGAYVPSDFSIVRAYPSKMLKWGYFPKTYFYDRDIMDGKGYGENRSIYILWAARMIDWKHPELVVDTAAYLKEKGYDFHIDMIGGGAMEDAVKASIHEKNLEDVITLPGYCDPDGVRAKMEKADIYLTTSDRKEGWGAVINEAMNSGCAVVASHMMGATPYLIKHEVNGLFFRDGCRNDIYEKTEMLVRDRKLCQQYGRSAMKTIQEEWNAKVAAERLVTFCVQKKFLCEEDVTEEFAISTQRPEHGPCSEAKVISERRMLKLLEKKKEI